MTDEGTNAPTGATGTRPSTPGLFVRFVRHPLVVLIIVLVLSVLFSVGLGTALTALGIFAAADLGGVPSVLVVDQVVRTVATLVAVYLVARFLERRPLTELAGPPKRAVRDLGLGFLGGALLLSITIGILAVPGWYGIEAIDFRPGVFFLALLGFLFVAIFEELFFRGIVFRLIEDWLGSYAALAISAAFFGWVHIGNANATWISSLAIAIEAGLLLGAIYMLTRTLWAVIGVHWAWNFFEGPVFGTPVSGFEIDALIDSRTTGPELFTGGAFGPEASLPMMILGTLLSIALLVLAHRRGQIVSPRWVRRRRSRAAVATAPI